MSQEPSRPPPRRGFEPLPEWVGPTTRLIHGARRPELNAGAVVPPIYQTSTFHYPASHSEAAEHGSVYMYTRNLNPSHEGPAEIIRQLEGAETARLFGSGMGAITTTLLSLLQPGDEVVALEGLYGGSLGILRTLLPKFGVRVRWVSEEAAHEPEAAIGPAARLVFIESPTNPLLRVHDIARWAEVAHRAGALLLVDNTFATPINQRPIPLGADLVVHSVTKYLGGHSDLIGGVLVGSKELVDPIDPSANVGSTLDPFAAFLLDRSLKTLSLRMARHNENGRRVAEALATHPELARVHYPGRASPEEEAIARRQMQGRSGVVSLSLARGASAIPKFLGRLRFVHVAASLGGVESLASVPGETSHRHLSAAERRARGIDDGLIRVSLGIEDAEDLIRDLTEALDTLR
ncbi:MAG TPA: PLP-dependent aspartate aminotransferase family protein [Thermoplasmata archaeon]|nr:PLP-dependent aspartate aminotransferase family protein [Thermoplasmata archaeon]